MFVIELSNGDERDLLGPFYSKEEAESYMDTNFANIKRRDFSWVIEPLLGKLRKEVPMEKPVYVMALYPGICDGPIPPSLRLYSDLEFAKKDTQIFLCQQISVDGRFYPKYGGALIYEFSYEMFPGTIVHSALPGGSK